MKSFLTILVLISCLSSIATSQRINGWGNLTPNKIYTESYNNNHNVAEYNPAPHAIHTSIGLNHDHPNAINAIYSLNTSSITLGAIDYITGAVTNLYSAILSKAYDITTLQGFAYDNTTNNLRFIAYTKDHTGMPQVDLVITNLDSSASKIIQFTACIAGRGIFDASSNTYFVITINVQYKYQCYWIDGTTYEIIKAITLDTFMPNQKYQIFANQQTLYIVHPTLSESLDIGTIDWNIKNVVNIEQVLIDGVSDKLQVSQTEVSGYSFVAIFSNVFKRSYPSIPLLRLPEIKAREYLLNLPAVPDNTDHYFIF